MGADRNAAGRVRWNDPTDITESEDGILAAVPRLGRERHCPAGIIGIGCRSGHAAVVPIACVPVAGQ
jgi:hypothetical protein